VLDPSAANQQQLIERELAATLGGFSRDPLKYALFNWPNADLRQWQVEALESITKQLADNPYEPIQLARASGHGIGKSALNALILHWTLETCELSRVVVTANTETQLRTKTWPEVTRWHDSSLLTKYAPSAFKMTATAKYHTQNERTWRADAIAWSEHNTEAFAGLHNKGYRIALLMDEASAIADKIWEVAEGALTDEQTEIIWCATGNPTRTVGRFRDCFGRYAHRWMGKQIDSRTVEGTNKVYLQKLVDDYGEDSDHVRIRVRGMFPKASSLQFIESDVVDAAMRREPLAGLRDPLIMTVDVARGGADEFSIGYRRGFDACSIPSINIPGSEARDSMKMVAKVVDLATIDDAWKRPDAIIVDETGVGGPIVDRLVQILGDNCQVYGVNFASASPDPKLANMRAYMWSRGRDALRMSLCIEDDPILEMQLCAPEYTHDRTNRVLLESKDDIRERIGMSTDRADRLMLSFAVPIQPRDVTELTGGRGVKSTTALEDHPWA
jgi:hypothetical protein